MRKYATIAAGVVILDQAVKLAAERLPGAVGVIPGVLGLRYARNTGMAFSLFSGAPWLLGLLSAALIALGVAALRRFRPGGQPTVAAMLMLGGAAGNMLDRLLRGYVVDMFELLFVRFAIFNVADAALTVGCLWMAGTLLFRPEDWRNLNGTNDGNPV